MLNIAISFSTLLYSLGLDQAYVRQYHEEDSKDELLKICISPGLILLFSSFLILYFTPLSLSFALFDKDDSIVSLISAFILLACFISRFLSLVLRMQENGLAYSFSQLFPKLMTLLVIGYFFFFYINHNFIQLILANAVGYLAVLIILLWSTYRDWIPAVKSKFDYKKMLEMMFFGFPLILGGLAFWGITAMDRVFLRSYSTFEQLAVFSVAVSFASAASIIQSVFSTVWAPMVYKIASDKDKGVSLVRKASKYMLVLVVGMFCLGGLFSWVVDLLLPNEYKNVKYIIVACLGLPLLYTLSETTVVGIGISRKTIYSMLASLLALIVNLIANYFMVPKFGASGAAVSTCFTFWIFLILRTEFSIISWNKIPRIEMYIFTGMCVIGASIGALYGDAVHSELFFYWLLVLIILVIKNRSMLSKIKMNALSQFRNSRKE
ncbi:Polysaccharide biosynthesis protein [Serratia plymuthica]|nr:Polysaccharide biosynthesis protein [Serratia plymuthica]